MLPSCSIQGCKAKRHPAARVKWRGGEWLYTCAEHLAEFRQAHALSGLPLVVEELAQPEDPEADDKARAEYLRSLMPK